jgi:hypothetical protein
MNPEPCCPEDCCPAGWCQFEVAEMSGSIGRQALAESIGKAFGWCP